MRPKEKGIEWTAASPSRFFIDDLEAIQASLLKVADRVEMETPDYEDIRNPSELEAIERKFRELEIRAYRGSDADEMGGVIRVNLLPDRIEVSTIDDEPDLRGVLDELKHIVWRCAKPFPPVLVGTMASLPLLFVLLSMAQSERRGEWGIAVIASMAILVIWAYRNSPFTTIVPEYRGASPSFWKRNRDALLISSIGIVVSGILAIAIAILDKG